MNYYGTKITALDPITGEMKNWTGPNIPAYSWDSAEKYLQENGLGYCEIDGIVRAEVDEETGEEELFNFRWN